MSAQNTITLQKHDAVMFEGFIEHDTLARHCLLDNGRHAMELDYTTAPSLGLVSQLPVELQQQVAMQMDLETLLVWRRVNKRAMDLVSHMIEWRHIILHAPNTLRVAIGLGSQSTFSLADLYNALSQRTCDTLDCTSDTVQYIDMSTLTRLCPTCFCRHAWRVWKSFESSLDFPHWPEVHDQMHQSIDQPIDRVISKVEEIQKIGEKRDPFFKVRVDARLGFVRVGAFKKRDGGITGRKGHGINGRDADRRWAGGSAWE